MKKILIAVAAMAAMAAANATTYEESLNTAVANNEKSMDLSYAWRDTGSLIKQAKKLMKSGLEADAIEVLARANQQALYAIEQARVGATAGPKY